MASTEIYIVSDAGRLRQGEILSGVVEYRVRPPEDGNSEARDFDAHTHPLAIVLSQDCDLDWDYRARRGEVASNKEIPNVLFCEVIEAEAFRGQEGMKSDIWRRIKGNSDARYAFLESVPGDADFCGQGVPDMGVDFKRYFAIPASEIYRQIKCGAARKRARLCPPYVEHLCSRFFGFQARVALPREHGQAPATE